MEPQVTELKQKNPGSHRDFPGTLAVNKKLLGLHHSADALGAQRHANLTPTFINADRLQVGLKSSQCGLL